MPTLEQLNGTVISDAEFFEMIQADLAASRERADQKLRTMGEFFGIPLEDLEERAGILQYDAGLGYAAAARQASLLALEKRLPGTSPDFLRELHEGGPEVKALEQEHSLSRGESLRLLFDRANFALTLVCRDGEGVSPAPVFTSVLPEHHDLAAKLRAGWFLTPPEGWAKSPAEGRPARGGAPEMGEFSPAAVPAATASRREGGLSGDEAELLERFRHTVGAESAQRRNFG